MDRIWQWAWDRYGPRYSWALGAISFPLLPSIYLIPSFGVVALEKSGHYVEAAAVTVVAVLVCGYVMALPGRRLFRLVEQWAAGHEVERACALEATYTWARGMVARAVVGNAVMGALGFGPRRCDRRSGRIAASPVRDVGHRLRSCHPAARCAQLDGSCAAAGEGRHRR